MCENLEPLYVLNCFPLENGNDKLLKLILGTQHAELQIQEVVSITTCAKLTLSDLRKGSNVYSFICKLRAGKQEKNLENISYKCFLIGIYTGKERTTDAKLILDNILHETCLCKFKVFTILQKGNATYYSQLYSKS